MAQVAGRILVVDDDRRWRATLRRWLESRGYLVELASDYSEALGKLRTSVFHLALVDLRLVDWDPTDESGMALLRALTESQAEAPNCIVVTGYGTADRAREAFKDFGVWDFIDKGSLDREELIHAVDEAVEDAVARTDRLIAPLLEAWDSASERLEPSHIREFSILAAKTARQIESILDLPPSPSIDLTYKRLVGAILDFSPIAAHTLLPSSLPVLFLQRPRLLKEDLDDIRHLLTQRLGVSTRIALLVLFCDESEMQRAQQLLEREMRRPYAYDILSVGRGDLQRILANKDPQRALRRFVTSQVDLITISPFTTIGPVPDSMFFGRERELRKISEHIATASYAIIGGRRIGKTSILGRLHRVRLPAAGFRTFYYQCQHLPSTEPTRQKVLEAIAHEWLPDLTDFTPLSFSDILAQLPDDGPLVFLIDEADRLIPADWEVGWPLFGELRALAESGRCQFVFSGERTLRDAMKNSRSPLFNFANAIHLGCLDFSAVKELITRPMKQLEIDLTDEVAIVQRIWDFTSGHPNVVQRLCQRLIMRLNERRDRRLIPEDIETVVADPSFQRDDFYDVFLEQATVLERILPLMLAQDANEPYTLGNVCCLLDERLTLMSPTGEKPRAAEVDAALRRLTDLRSILDYTPQGYVFAVKAFPQVIAHWGQVTVEDELMILTEKYRDWGDLTEDEIEQKERDR